MGYGVEELEWRWLFGKRKGVKCWEGRVEIEPEPELELEPERVKFDASTREQ